MQWILVDVDNDGQSRHQKQEKDNPKLLNASLSATKTLPQESDETEQKRQSVIHVVPFVLLQYVGQQRLIAQTQVVEQWDARYPVAVFKFSLSLNVVLPAAEVPHEVAPIHKVALIGEEEAKVFPLGWHFHAYVFATIVVRHHVPIDVPHPCLVGIGLLRVPHAGKEHVLCIDQSVLSLGHVVAVALRDVCRVLRQTLIDGGSFLHLHLHHLCACHGFPFGLRGVGLPIDKRALSVLVACQVVGQREDILWRVLVHRRIGRRAYQDEGIAAIANDQHEQAEQGSVEQRVESALAGVGGRFHPLPLRVPNSR